MLEKIQKLCKQKGMNIYKLEKDLNFSNGSMYKWEKSSPSIDKIQKVSDYFNVSVNDLLDRTDDDAIVDWPEGYQLLQRVSRRGKLTPEKKKTMLKIIEAYLEEDEDEEKTDKN